MEKLPSPEHASTEISSIVPPNEGVQSQDHTAIPEVLEHPCSPVFRTPSNERKSDFKFLCWSRDIIMALYIGAEQKADISKEEVKKILEAVACTGKFWQDWEKLKEMLSCWLKKVLSEYPEANMLNEQQKEVLGVTYPELVSRLNEALLSFDEGPPFTLQRLCEILLAARSIYPKLSKLALALEKNLLVTSMLAISKETQSQTTENPDAVTAYTKTAAAD